MDAFIGDLIIFLFFALPAAAVIWFVASLIGFFKTKPQQAEQPERFRRWRGNLIASAIVASILVAFCVGIVVLLMAAVAHM